MKSVLELILIILVIVLGIGLALGVVALFIALGGLIAWGIGNGIIYLFGISAIWTYWHGCIAAAILYGIGWLYRKFLKG